MLYIRKFNRVSREDNVITEEGDDGPPIRFVGDKEIVSFINEHMDLLDQLDIVDQDNILIRNVYISDLPIKSLE